MKQKCDEFFPFLSFRKISIKNDFRRLQMIRRGRHSEKDAEWN